MARFATLLIWGLFVTAACDLHAHAAIEGRRLNASSNTSEFVVSANLYGLDYCANNMTLLDLVKTALVDEVAYGLELQKSWVSIEFAPCVECTGPDDTLVIFTFAVPSDYKPDHFEDHEQYDVEVQWGQTSFGWMSLSQVAPHTKGFSGFSKGAPTTTGSCSESTTAAAATTASNSAGGSGSANVTSVATASEADAPRTPRLLVFAVAALALAQ